MNPSILGVIAIAFIVAVWFVRSRDQRGRKHITDAFSKFIYCKTVEALMKDGAAASLQQDGLWIKEHERELVERYGSQWIAVVNAEVLTAAANGETAWNEASAKHPSRAPFVKQLSSEHINFQAGQK